MAFIDKDAILGYMKDDNLFSILKGEDAILDAPISDAESIIRDYLSHRYNVDTIFANPTEPKYRTLRKCAIDIAIYNLYSGHVNPRHIPELRAMNYDYALKLLEKIAKGMVGNDFPLLDDDTKPLGRNVTQSDDLIETLW